MRKYLVAVLTLLACGLPAAQAVMINFEWYPGPDGILGTGDDIPITAPTLFSAQTEQLTKQFQTVGILFTPDPPTDDKNEILDAATFTTPPQHTRPNILASSGTLTIEGRFTLPIFEIGALIGISGGADRLDIYDASNNLLGSIVGDDQEVVLQTVVPIDRFVISPVASTTPAIDNLYFIPEPASLALLGLGSLALRRR